MSDENTPPTADTPLMGGAHPEPCPPGVMAEREPPPYVLAPGADLPGVPQYNPPGGPQMYPPAGPKNYPPDGPQNYPAGGPQNYLAGGPQMCLMGAPQTTVIMAPPMQSTILMGVQLTVTPAVMTCPYCLQIITTRVSYTAGLLAWVICGVISLIGFWMGCCLIPFCIDGCKDADHFCPNCNQHIHKYKRIG